jgi:hypothetical protein
MIGSFFGMMRFFSFTGLFRYYWFTGVAAAAGLAGRSSQP